VSRKRPPAAKSLPGAMIAIFATPAGRALHDHLTTVAMTLSAVRPTTGGALALTDQRSTDIAEGRRWLAIELLGAVNNEGDKNG
jgi:hypothetical protein